MEDSKARIFLSEFIKELKRTKIQDTQDTQLSPSERQIILDKQQDRDHKAGRFKEDKEFRDKIYLFIAKVTTWYLLFVGVIIISNGAANMYILAHYKALQYKDLRFISDKALITLLTTTTVTILGLIHIIVSYFFPNKKQIKGNMND